MTVSKVRTIWGPGAGKEGGRRQESSWNSLASQCDQKDKRVTEEETYGRTLAYDA